MNNNILFTYILGLVLLVGTTVSIMYDFMLLYMGIFFVFFSLMKLGDVNGFAKAFTLYDPLSKTIPGYALLYPFLEFFLGVSFIVNHYFMTSYLPLTSWITLVVMVTGGIGVGQKLLSKVTFHCACLGTFIKLPLTKITLLENVLMAIMVARLLFF